MVCANHPRWTIAQLIIVRRSLMKRKIARQLKQAYVFKKIDVLLRIMPFAFCFGICVTSTTGAAVGSMIITRQTGPDKLFLAWGKT